MRIESPPPDIVDRLAEHRTIGRAPRTELEWLAGHGTIRYFEAGEYVARTGWPILNSDVGFLIVLKGRMAIHVDRGAGPRRVMEWQGGDITGYLPFSRMTVYPGDTIAETLLEGLSIRPDCFPELIRDCPEVTGICVHVMLDRARVFNTSDWQDEKMMALGKLAAGLAHELNNPASAVARSGRLIQECVAQAQTAARALALARLDEAQMDAVDRVREACMREAGPVARSPLDRADREDALLSWFERHGVDDSVLEALVDTAIAVEDLEALASVLRGDALDAALGWVAAGCAMHALAYENERAASRISDLVGSMKRLTHMDRAPVAELMDVGQGIRDTLAILGHKARSKSATVTVDVPADLPPVNAIGGELNQVWMNLLDNALDAIEPGGNVVVTAAPEGQSIVVRVIDDGPGVAPEHQNRIFDPFFTTKPPGEGTGLGLEVARTRARGNGGDIDFDSEPGRTEFRVFLPLREDGPGVG